MCDTHPFLCYGAWGFRATAASAHVVRLAYACAAAVMRDNDRSPMRFRVIVGSSEQKQKQTNVYNTHDLM